MVCGAHICTASEIDDPTSRSVPFNSVTNVTDRLRTPVLAHHGQHVRGHSIVGWVPHTTIERREVLFGDLERWH